jgi:hypothetical protein
MESEHNKTIEPRIRGTNLFIRSNWIIVYIVNQSQVNGKNYIYIYIYIYYRVYCTVLNNQSLLFFSFLFVGTVSEWSTTRRSDRSIDGIGLYCIVLCIVLWFFVLSPPTSTSHWLLTFYKAVVNVRYKMYWQVVFLLLFYLQYYKKTSDLVQLAS